MNLSFFTNTVATLQGILEHGCEKKLSVKTIRTIISRTLAPLPLLLTCPQLLSLLNFSLNIKLI